jgi:transcription elongation factor Elf1
MATELKQPNQQHVPAIQTDLIKCPSCNHEQLADVLATYPFHTFIHTCEKCEYIIMESEWNVIVPDALNVP